MIIHKQGKSGGAMIKWSVVCVRDALLHEEIICIFFFIKRSKKGIQFHFCNLKGRKDKRGKRERVTCVNGSS